MGVDIHMHILDKDGKILDKEIFDGRNSEWFNNLQGNGWDDEYDHFPAYCGLPEVCPKEISQFEGEIGYYGFNFMTVGEFNRWFIKYRPDLKAGWVSTYDKWRIEKKHYIPEDLPQYLSSEDNKDDMHFVEYVNTFDCSRWLYQYIKEKNFSGDDYIVYYFDH